MEEVTRIQRMAEKIRLINSQVTSRVKETANNFSGNKVTGNNVPGNKFMKVQEQQTGIEQRK